MTFPTDPATPIADQLGETPHYVPPPLARRLRSEACLKGADDCTDPMCLCTCHDRDFPEDPDDHFLQRVLSGLDQIIAQVPGSFAGFAVPPPFYPADREGR
jgi:hypothetical protein